jgi:hypothetical protein
MTPADIIRPCLAEADRRKPHLRIDNRMPTCFELLQDALALGGPDWAFIGKSTTKGESGFRPSWLIPQSVPCIRPDGQREIVTIDLLSMDAAWHLPSKSQVKVIVNSTANDDLDPKIHGPARLDSYDIARTNSETGQPNYRWHNPPVQQRAGSGTITPPPVTPTTPSGILAQDVALQRLTQLNDFYAAADGLKRPGGMIDSNGRVDTVAIAQWFYQMVIYGKSWDDVRSQIRHSNEWRTKHPGETP